MVTATTKPVMRLRLRSGEADLAVRRNTPENNMPKTNSATLILRLSDSGLDQRNHAIAEQVRKVAKKRPKPAIDATLLGRFGFGGDGISSNMS